MKAVKAQPIMTDASNTFAHHTMEVRLPAIIDEMLRVHSRFPALIRDKLVALHDEVTANKPIRMIDRPAPDWEYWSKQAWRRRAQRWLETEWFFAEQLFYRRILEAVRWWESGQDPFLPMKRAEYGEARHWDLLERALSATEGETDEQALHSLLSSSLWGNRIDLSYTASADLGAHGNDSADLLIDDRGEAARLLLSGADGGSRRDDGTVHIVTDNAGSELTMDLVLVDALLRLAGRRVALHVKLHPTYVSDATASDVMDSLTLIAERGSRSAGEAAARLRAAFDAGRLRLFPDLYWNSCDFIGRLPRRLRAAFASAHMVIFKGDANYRRLSSDSIWPAGTSASEAVGSFPAPLLLLRTLKSDTLFGVSAAATAALDRSDPTWRSNAKRGVAQLIR